METVHHHMTSQIKLSLYILGFSLLVLALGVWFVMGRYSDIFHTNNFQMGSLYTEVGDARGENERVYNELKKTQSELKATMAVLENINDKLSTIEGEDVSQIKVDVDALSEKLSKNPLIARAVDKEGEVILEYPEEVMNFLLIGQNQGLTDTIMVVAINPNTKRITLISVPRDLYVNGRRINEIYHHYGIEKLKDALQDILGLKISEYAAVDLEGFEAAVDVLGGLDIYVDEDIYDYQYPTANKGYQVFNLKAGQYNMDGASALKFARSRKSTSDFDRAERQQKVIEAMLRKVKEMKLQSDKEKAVDFFNTVSDYVHTDMEPISAYTYLKMFKDFQVEKNNVLSSSNYLYSMINASGAYVLLPRSGDYDEIKGYVFELVVE